MSEIEKKLAGLGYTLPEAALPAANYVPTVQAGGQLIVSGQLPMREGRAHYIGKVGREVSLEDAQECARLCGLNILAQSRLALGDLDRIARLLRLGVFVNATEDFTDHPNVANGVSDLMVELLGEAGKHARAAVGVGSLPFGVAVEVEATFELT